MKLNTQIPDVLYQQVVHHLINMKNFVKKQYRISIWGKFPENHETAPCDYLWHTKVQRLPKIGEVLSFLDTTFMVEKISVDKFLEEKEINYIIEVRHYIGSIPPSYKF